MESKKEFEYHFSKSKLVFATLLLFGFTSLFSYLILIFYKENLLVAFIFALPLIVLLPVVLPDYFHFLYCAIIKRPALILTNDELIDNMNRRTYKWSEIRAIEYAKESKNPGGYTAIFLKDSDKEIKISHNGIEGRGKGLIKNLVKYHKRNQRQ